MRSAALTMNNKRSFGTGMVCPTSGWSRPCASIIRRQRRDRRLRKSCDMHSRLRHAMTLPIIMEDIRDRGLSLNVVAMATKAKVEPERARSEAPALLFLPNILVDQVSGNFLKGRIKPRLNALENLLLPKAKRKATAMAKALRDVG